MCIYIICTFSCILKVHINKYSSKSYFSDFIKRNISHIPINSEHIYLSIPFPIFLLTSSQRFSSKVLSFKLLFCHYKRGWSFHVVNICIYLLNNCTSTLGFPHGSGVKNPPVIKRHRRCGFSLWVGKIHWRRNWQPTPVFLPGKNPRRVWWATVRGVTKSCTWLSN